MRRPGFFRSKKALFGLGLVLVLGGVLWFERLPILAWYYLRGLAAAEEGERARWVRRVVSLDGAALPGLLHCLKRADARGCANAGVALSALLERWGLKDPRCAALTTKLAEAFASCSLSGQLAILDVEAALVASPPGTTPPPAVSLAAGRILCAAGQAVHPGLQARALALADALADQTLAAEVLPAIHTLARAGLTSADGNNRLRAVHLVRSRALQSDTGLLERVVPLLRDASALVRREALRAVGLKDKLLSDDDLLAWLHDPDAEVQRLCEKALFIRGLWKTEISAGRQITDPLPQERNRTVLYLNPPDASPPAVRSPGDWILRMCDDPTWAVRISGVRAAGEQKLFSLSDRLQEMARTDRAPTVRQEADYWYRRLQQAQLGGRSRSRRDVAQIPQGNGGAPR